MLIFHNFYVEIVKAHFTRLVSSSKVAVSGLAIKDLLERTYWFKETNLKKFYHENIKEDKRLSVTHW